VEVHIKQVKYFFISYIFLSAAFINKAYAYVYPDTGESFIDAIVPFAFAILFLAPWLWALIDIVKSEFSGRNKVIWLWVVRLVPVLGFILYFLIGRKKKIPANASYALSKN